MLRQQPSELLVPEQQFLRNSSAPEHFLFQSAPAAPLGEIGELSISRSILIASLGAIGIDRSTFSGLRHLAPSQVPFGTFHGA